MHVVFDCGEPYYAPQYLPVVHALIERGHRVSAATYAAFDPLGGNRLDAQVDRFASPAAACDAWQRAPPDWVVFGNGTRLLASLPPTTRSALLYHGIGVKECYYEADLCGFDVRFVEGEQRARQLAARYPGEKYATVGFAKLDPLFGDSSLAGLPPGFEPAAGRARVLYAPTYFPSSIEELADDFPAQIAEFDLLVKPHYFTLSRPRHASQRARLAAWSEHDNVYVTPAESVSILPWLRIADLLVSEASSTIFEFAALDRPIVWCDFFKLRWSYRGPFRYRLARRLDPTIDRYADIAAHARTPHELATVVRHQLDNPAEFAERRLAYTADLVGATDGRASQRIVDYLESAPR